MVLSGIMIYQEKVELGMIPWRHATLHWTSSCPSSVNPPRDVLFTGKSVQAGSRNKEQMIKKKILSRTGEKKERSRRKRRNLEGRRSPMVANSSLPGSPGYSAPERALEEARRARIFNSSSALIPKNKNLELAFSS